MRGFVGLFSTDEIPGCEVDQDQADDDRPDQVDAAETHLQQTRSAELGGQRGHPRDEDGESDVASHGVDYTFGNGVRRLQSLDATTNIQNRENLESKNWIYGTIQLVDATPPHAGGAFFGLDPPGVEMAESKTDPEENMQETPQVTNLDRSSAEVIEAELVRMHQSAVQEITADEVDLHQAAALDVTAAEVSAHEAALGLVNARDVEMTNSAAAAVRAENVNVVGQAGVVLANSVILGNTYAGVVAANQIQGERIETLFLFSNHVEGDVQTVVDTRGALIAGMVGGLLTGIILLIGRLVFGRE
jgi:hypothetical protein